MRILRRIWPQPLIAATCLAAGGVSLAACWLASGASALAQPVGPAVLAVVLGTTLVLTQPFTIHVRENTKVQIASLLAYLIVVLLPIPIAVTTILVSTIAGDVYVRAERGTYLSDILTQAGRMTTTALGATLVAHVGAAGTVQRS